MRRNRLQTLAFTLLATGAATPAWASYTLTTLASFNGTTQGGRPQGDLTVSSDGTKLYGTTPKGGNGISPDNGNGTIFSVPIVGGTITPLATFNGGTQGANPYGGLLLYGTTLYGVARAGGDGENQGTVFSVPVGGGTITPTATFNGTNGWIPSCDLLLSGSTLYGTSLIGGSSNKGNVFSVPRAGGTITLLGSFNGAALGGAPSAGLILSGNGTTLYGTAYSGGDANGDGVVFSMPSNGGTPTVLASFNGTNGSLSTSSLILSGSTLYGTTTQGGANGGGTVFSVPVGGGSITDLASFSNNGNYLSAGLTLIGNTLYGTTENGGAHSDGEVFSLPITGGTPTVLASFNGLAGNASNPVGGLLYTGGNLYGTTAMGGNGNGTVYELSGLPSGTTYNLTAAISGGSLINSRLTQGQTANLTSTIFNSGNSTTGDILTYTGLSIVSQSLPGGAPSGNLTINTSGLASGMFTASTTGSITLVPTVTNFPQNPSMGAAATAGTVTDAFVLVDPLVEHVNATTITDTGNAGTTPTAFYRRNAAWGGQNLGNITVTKTAPGIYFPGYLNNFNGGSGTAVGTLGITVSGYDNQFGADASIILLGFTNVSHSGNPTVEKGLLSTLESSLTSAGIDWKDAFGNSHNWPSVITGPDPLTGTNAFQTIADYDLELAFNDGSLTSSTSYFDFNFTGQLGGAGNVVNIALVPEPASMSLLALGSTTLLARRRRRHTTRSMALAA